MNEYDKKIEERNELVSKIVPLLEELQCTPLYGYAHTAVCLLPEILEWALDPICKVCGRTMYCPNGKTYPGQLSLIRRKFCSRNCADEWKVKECYDLLVDNLKACEGLTKSVIYKKFKKSGTNMRLALNMLVEEGIIDECMLQSKGVLVSDI